MCNLPSLSVVIPIYNEEQGIAALIERLRGLRENTAGVALEFLFVDDHSNDGTPELLRQSCTAERGFRYLRLSRNSGSHVAILAGLEHAKGDCVVFLAADLQDPPELIPTLVELWRQGNHVVWAVREQREGVGRAEILFARIFYWLMKRVGMVEMPQQGSDFALIDRRVVVALLQCAGATPSIGGEIARLGFRQVSVPYTKSARQSGSSKWTMERKLRAFADAFVAFSYVPLRFISYFGIVCSLASFLYALLVIALRLISSHPVPGWSVLMVVILFLGGVQMTMLGVLGEYLWRTLEAARRRPRSFIEDAVGISTINEGDV